MVGGLVGGDMGVEATSASNWVEVEAEAELRDLVFLWFEVNSQWLRINSLITLNVKPIKYLSQAYSMNISVLTQVRLRHQGIPIWGGTPLHQDLSPPHSEEEDSVATICGFGDEFHDLKV